MTSCRNQKAEAHWLRTQKDDCSAKGGRHVKKKVGPHVCTLYPES